MRFITKNVIRNLIYLCTLNSKNRYYSQCYQYAKTLESMLEEILEIKRPPEVLGKNKSLDMLARCFRAAEGPQDASKTRRMLGLAFYFCGKSLSRLKNAQKANSSCGSLRLP